MPLLTGAASPPPGFLFPSLLLPTLFRAKLSHFCHPQGEYRLTPTKSETVWHIEDGFGAGGCPRSPAHRQGTCRGRGHRSPAHRAGYVSRPGGQAGGRSQAPGGAPATKATRRMHKDHTNQTRENKCARAEARAHSRIETRRGLPQRGRRMPVRRRRSQRHRGSPRGSTLPHDPGS